MSGIFVSNYSELMAALGSATNGAVIYLEDANYGSVVIEDFNPSSNVTLKAAGDEANLSYLEIFNSTNITVDGLHVDSPNSGGTSVLRIEDSHHITIQNTEVNGDPDQEYPISGPKFGIYTYGDSTNITLENNYVHHTLNGIVMYGTDEIVVSNNTVNYIGSDAFKFSGNDGGVIEYNTGPTHFYPTEDAHADFMQFGNTTCSDLLIRGNVLILENRFDMQGIFMKSWSGPYNDVVIEDNLIYTAMANGIYVNESGNGVIVQSNTLVNAESDSDSVTRIYAPDATVTGNIITTRTGSEGSNLTVQQVDPSKAYYYTDIFENFDTRDGISPEDFQVAAEYQGRYGVSSLSGEFFGKNIDSSTITEEETISDNNKQVDEVQYIPPEGGSYDDPLARPQTMEFLFGSVRDVPLSAFMGSLTISTSEDVIELKPSEELNFSEATIAFNFSAASLDGRQGLVSKDAYMKEGGGKHFTSYLDGGALIVRFQNENSEETFELSGISANTEYSVTASFGNGEVSVWLNGDLFDTRALETSWEKNNEYLQIGANGWGSKTGEAGFSDVFDGTISDVIIAGKSMTYDEMGSLKSLLQAELTGDAESDELSGPPPEEVFPYEPLFEEHLQEDPIALPDDPVEENPNDLEASPEGRSLQILALLGESEFNRSDRDVIEIAPDEDLKLASATLSFSFNADRVSGKQGLVSKDAYEYEGGGNHFASYLVRDTLYVRFQDGSTTKAFTFDGIEADKEYAVTASFGDGKVSAWLDGNLIGESALGTSWETNEEYLQIGANGWGSNTGEAGFTHLYDGTIYDVVIAEGRHTPEQMKEMIIALKASEPDSDSSIGALHAYSDAEWYASVSIEIPPEAEERDAEDDYILAESLNG